MYSNEPIKYYKNRRGGPDAIIKWLDVASVLTWFFILFNISMFLYARPRSEGFFDRLFNVQVRDYWDTRSLTITFILSAILFVLSLISIYLNTKRLKRKTDRIRKSLIVSAAFSMIMMLGIIIFY
jgi:cytochrome c oxidase assembly factor CtaG